MSSHADSHEGQSRDATNAIARLTLFWFVLTFIAARVLVLLIMLKWVPTLYLRVGGTHVHHLNYGIILLSLVGGYLLFAWPSGSRRRWAAIVYAIGLGLTFDEFGMWIHLGGPYWQRASFDAVVVIAGLLGIVAYAPSLNRLKPTTWATAGVMLVAISLFAVVLVKSLRFAGNHISPALVQIEAAGPAE